MTSQAVSKHRRFPFREHRTMAEVNLCALLEAQPYNRLEHAAKIRLQRLQCRVVLPPERDPPSAA